MSTDPHLDFEVRRYKAIREALLAAGGDDIDEQTLADTTEGLTDLHELLAAIVRGALEDETMAAMLKVRMDQMADRMDRIEHRAERYRQIVKDAMLEAGVDKLAMPDFTASVRKGPPHVVIVDEALIPEDYIEQRPHLLKREIGEALKNGTHVEGAVLSNPGDDPECENQMTHNVIKLKKLDIRPDLASIDADRMLIEQTASYVKNLWQQVNAAEMYIAAGREFKNLHEHLKKNNQHDKSRIGWHRAFEKQENKFGLERRQAEGYIKIYEAFFQVGNALPTWKLPQSFRALRLLAKLKLSGERLETLLASGKIGPQSTEAEIRAAIKGPKKKKTKTQSLEKIPDESAPKRVRIEAAFALLARLGLTVDDLKKEFER